MREMRRNKAPKRGRQRRIGVVHVLVACAIGYLLDKAFGTHFLYLVFLVLGTAAGFVQLIRQFLRDSRDNES